MSQQQQSQLHNNINNSSGKQRVSWMMNDFAINEIGLRELNVMLMANCVFFSPFKTVE